MADSDLPALLERLDALERLVRELRARVAALEAQTRVRVENPLDTAAVRDKSVYDWQGPR